LERGIDRPGFGVVHINNWNLTSTGLTELPVVSHGVPDEVFRSTFRVSNAARLTLTNDFTLGDIWLDTTNAILNLNGFTLYVNTEEHPIGVGQVQNWGNIVWWTRPRGTYLLFW
ncbi:MAG: hypothetical protein GX811_01795, partial [Lentisphaerae bacterium]|nr:hypothetical protein [Lentisphaerota bacterium]